MILNLDPASLDACMSLWRASVDLQLPMRDEFKLHFIERRGEILAGYEKSATAWLMALRPAVPAPESRVEFDDLIAQIEAFKAWAAAELKTLTDMATVEAVHHGIDELLQDPSAAAALREIAKKIRPENDPQA